MSGLSVVLREATREAHRAVEELPFVKRLMGGEVGIEEFVRYTAHLLALYEVLEEQLRRFEGAGCCGGLLVRGLERAERLRADLREFGWTRAEEWELSERVRGLGEGREPERLAGHFYVRYFGDLSGGQFLAQALGRVTGGRGLSFYDFSELGGAGEVKGMLRGRLDALALDEEQRRNVVEEAVLAFEAHGRLFSGF